MSDLQSTISDREIWISCYKGSFAKLLEKLYCLNNLCESSDRWGERYEAWLIIVSLKRYLGGCGQSHWKYRTTCLVCCFKLIIISNILQFLMNPWSFYDLTPQQELRMSYLINSSWTMTSNLFYPTNNPAIEFGCRILCLFANSVLFASFEPQKLQVDPLNFGFTRRRNCPCILSTDGCRNSITAPTCFYHNFALSK